MVVGLDDLDDAGVIRHRGSRLLQTVDFFTPVVDTPRIYGEIAAANALSDVYAMGGKPLSALAVLCFPSEKVPAAILRQVMQGALAKLHEAGAVLMGGHTVRDQELKFGLAVTGYADQALWTNKGAKPGDCLLLSKPLGTGVLTSALRNDWVTERRIGACISGMRHLNADAAGLLRRYTVHACTDVTGFGLLGHLQRMLERSRVGAKLFAARVPLYPLAEAMWAKGARTAGGASNEAHYGRHVKAADSRRLPLFYDPQTSGGLLVAMPEKEAEAAVAAAGRRGLPLSCVGEVTRGPAGRIEVL